jgi:hypothetical protein
MQSQVGEDFEENVIKHYDDFNKYLFTSFKQNKKE